jgi:hypothetical protein
MIVNLMVFLGVAVLTVGFMTVGLGILAGLARVMLIGGSSFIGVGGLFFSFREGELERLG